ncbi:MAG TPA: hydroxyphenylacetyl-CoA thioesterase PaaI [Trueperaceae bacterium]
MSFAELLGFERLSAGQGRAHLRATVTAQHLNMHGTAHGGFAYSLADEAFALASNSHGATAVALSTRMDYFRALREGDVIEALAREEHLGRRVATYRIEVRRGDEPVALFTGTVYRLPEAAP